MSNMFEYFDALERLKAGKPNIVHKGQKITNDSVALEAGRKKGSIKKSRPQFKKLIEEIENAKRLQEPRGSELREKLDQEKKKTMDYREKYENLLSEYLMLLDKWHRLTR